MYKVMMYHVQVSNTILDRSKGGFVFNDAGKPSPQIFGYPVFLNALHLNRRVAHKTQRSSRSINLPKTENLAIESTKLTKLKVAVTHAPKHSRKNQRAIRATYFLAETQHVPSARSPAAQRAQPSTSEWEQIPDSKPGMHLTGWNAPSSERV